MSDPDTDPTEEQARKARELSESFASDARKIGKDQLRKIHLGGMIVLKQAGNRFAVGFGEEDKRKAREGDLLGFAEDVVQWREVCAATKEQVREWRNNPDRFREHCDDIIDAMPVDLHAITQMFVDVMEAQAEIQNSQVEVKEQKTKGGGASGKAKKKAPSRARKRSTASR